MNKKSTDLEIAAEYCEQITREPLSTIQEIPTQLPSSPTKAPNSPQIAAARPIHSRTAISNENPPLNNAPTPRWTSQLSHPHGSQPILGQLLEQPNLSNHRRFKSSNAVQQKQEFDSPLALKIESNVDRQSGLDTNDSDRSYSMSHYTATNVLGSKSSLPNLKGAIKSMFSSDKGIKINHLTTDSSIHVPSTEGRDWSNTTVLHPFTFSIQYNDKGS